VAIAASRLRANPLPASFRLILLHDMGPPSSQRSTCPLLRGKIPRQARKVLARFRGPNSAMTSGPHVMHFAIRAMSTSRGPGATCNRTVSHFPMSFHCRPLLRRGHRFPDTPGHQRRRGQTVTLRPPRPANPEVVRGDLAGDARPWHRRIGRPRRTM
jgi:hypothetical protein